MMAIENKYIFFPVTKTGYWHNGIHKYKKNIGDFVISPFVGKVLVKNQNITTNILYPTKVPKNIYVREIILTAPKVAEKYENLSSIDFTKLKKDEQEKLLEAIGLSSNPAYVLQKHTIAFNNKTFSYYSFVRHFSKLCDFKKIKNDEYIFPHDKVGEYGKSEGENNMIHLEYFIRSDSDYFNITAPCIFDYCNDINNEVDLYKKEEQFFEELYFSKRTEFSVLNTEEDFTTYSHSLHLKIKNYHVEINETYLKENNLELKPSDNIVNIFDQDNNKMEKIAINIINPNTNNTEIKLVETQYLSYKKNDKNDTFYFYNGNDPYNLQDFWTEADHSKLQQWGTRELSDNYIFFKNNAPNKDGRVLLKKYNLPPDKKIFSKLETREQIYHLQFFRIQETGITVLQSIDDRKFAHIKENGEDFYFLVSDIKYDSNYWKDFKESTTIFFKDDLSSYNPNDDEYKNSRDLQEIMKNKNIIDIVNNMDLKEFLQTKKDKIIKCAFQHISEWSQIEFNPFKIDHFEETSDLWEKLHIWGKNGESRTLPKEISDSGKFIYFHPQYFENWLFKLHQCFAKKLISVQDRIMQDWRMLQGNSGIYYNFSNAEQTFCNQAVFETIKRVDGNYTNFTNRKEGQFPEIDNIHENEYKQTSTYKEIEEDLKKWKNKIPYTEFKRYEKNRKSIAEYPYKKSNYWCDILEQQAANSGETGIHRITAEQAFYMARLGYVVVAAWKNLTPKGNDPNLNYSPHFVTIRPCDGEYPGLELLKVAHVGGGTNKETYLLSAFDTTIDDSKLSEIKYYCNIKQSFI